MSKIAIGSDHAGYEYKGLIYEFLEKSGHSLKDYGTYSSESADYADFAHPVASAVEEGEYEKGILICGSANGVAMTANKHQGIRAAICWNTELAALARQHNDANILCIPARFVDTDMAKNMVKTFLSSDFEGGRHKRRIDKIGC
ncbi:ribose 5-phosphate isomerase B [Fulvivirga sp. M361]|uniref:ribose 5-phosphate isomerase B n=1 Tax=Fulvivirga sp. M361 TaxID=2594266 RepID=UPI00117A1ABB|nr:ribose 5-phosphate isomerase B [Fulvivirga sp. M361]TRX50446.1 ribose 5-phosphate isomerase B [Fulvivirga sp. M361]